jgi:hypothetical protein
MLVAFFIILYFHLEYGCLLKCAYKSAGSKKIPELKKTQIVSSKFKRKLECGIVQLRTAKCGTCGMHNEECGDVQCGMCNEEYRV